MDFWVDIAWRCSASLCTDTRAVFRPTCTFSTVGEKNKKIIYANEYWNTINDGDSQTSPLPIFPEGGGTSVHRLFRFTYVLFGVVVVLYHINDGFGVTVNVINISERYGFVCRVECVWSLSVRYVFTSDSFSVLVWLWAPRLVVLCDIAKFGPN